MSFTATVASRKTMDHWPLLVIYIVLIIIGCITNTLFVIAILKHRHVLPVTASILASLFGIGIATCISSTGFFIQKLSAHLGWEEHITVDPIMKLALYLASEFHLALAAFERHVAIVYPFRHAMLFSRRRICLAIACCYLLPCILIFTILAVHGYQHGDVPKWMTHEDMCSIYWIYISFEILPGVVVVLGYVRVYMAARNQRRKITTVNNENSSIPIRPIIVLLITATYSALLWCVAGLITVLICTGMIRLSDTKLIIASETPILIVALHPVVYGLGDRTIRKKVINCFKRNHRVSAQMEVYRA